MSVKQNPPRSKLQLSIAVVAALLVLVLGALAVSATGLHQTEAATVMVATHDQLGDILVDAKGMTLYNFTKDEGADSSTCYEKCAVNWPPLLTVGDPIAGEGADAELLGTVERTDGTMQVTYNGWPLYYYITDEAPGDVTGQEKGDVWFVLSPAGEMITFASAAAAMAAAAEEAAMAEKAAQQQMFQVAVATYLIDSAGFSDLDERLNGDGEIQSGDAASVHGIWRIVKAADWPEGLQDQIDALIDSLSDLAQALSDEDQEVAAPLAAGVSEMSGMLSASVDEWMAAEEMAGDMEDAESMDEMSATVMVATHDKLGDILVDAHGMTLYNFTKDEGADGSTCYEKCAVNWPPLLVEGEPTVGPGLNAELLGTVERTDGTMQVTYNGWPLYYYITDEAAGDVTGQTRGDVWFVLTPDGEMITTSVTN